MDFDDDPADAAFRTEARQWLAHNVAKPDRRDGPVRSITSVTPESLADACRLQGALCDADLAGISWPVEHGGRGGTVVQEMIFQQEAAGYDLPTEVFLLGLALAGPTIIAHGTRSQQQRFLPPMLRGAEIWCQLFSEPNAGSDLAGLTTRADPDGDGWIVHGQKVWNSGAAIADWGILLARTDRTRPKHKGLSYFLVDMHAPGILVRPLRQISGHEHFCEVFLDGVRVAGDNLLGEVNGGWAVAHTTLMNERIMLGGSLPGADPAPVIALARRAERDGRPATEDLVIRQRLADLYIRSQLLRFLGYRTITGLSRGAPPGPEGSIAKLSFGQILRDLTSLALELEGPAGIAGDEPTDSGAWQESFLTAPALRIAGGTDEIQRNILAERILGLPREPDPSRVTTTTVNGAVAPTPMKASV